MSLLARTWQRRSRLFQVFVVVGGGAIVCVTAGRLAHPLPTEVRAGVGGALACAGGVLATRPALDLLLSQRRIVGLVLALFGIAFGVYFALGLVTHDEPPRIVCAAVGAAILAGVLGGKEGVEDEPVKDATKRGLVLFGCFLPVLGGFVAVYPW